MAQEFATVTAKGQVTVPKAVRDALGLRQGDQLSWIVEDGWVRVRPITPLDQAYLKSLESQLGEWSGDDDEQAFADL
jgi:antitoxin PrlF